jgi:hypothetical protein
VKQITRNQTVLIFLSTLLLTYVWLYFKYGELINTALGGQFNITRLKEVRDNFEYWEIDNISSNMGLNGYLKSAFFWLPIVISDLFNIPILFIQNLQTLTFPVLTLFLFYKLSGLFYKNESEKILPPLIIAIGNWGIFNLSLASIPVQILNGYVSDLFYVLFLAGLYFFFKKDLLKTGIVLFISPLCHPALAVWFGSFIILSWPIINKDEDLKNPAKLILFFIAGLAIEYFLTQRSFQGEELVPFDIYWELLLTSGHMNFINTHPETATKNALALTVLIASAFFICEDRILRKSLLCGLGFLMLMLIVYLVGFHFQIPLLIKLTPLRFSNLLIWLIILSIQVPRKLLSLQGLCFCIILCIVVYCGKYSFLHLFRYPYHHYNFTVSEFLNQLINFSAYISVGVLISAFAIKFKFKNIKSLFVGALMTLALISPFGMKEKFENPVNIKYYEAINFIRSEIGSRKSFIFWNAGYPRDFRILTGNAAIDPSYMGLWQYNMKKSLYNKDLLKTKILVGDKPMSISERRTKVDKVMQQPYSQEYHSYYQKHFNTEFLIGISTVESVGSVLFDNGFFKIFRLPKK